MKKTKHVFILENNPAESLSLDHFLLTNSDVNILLQTKWIISQKQKQTLEKQFRTVVFNGKC